MLLLNICDDTKSGFQVWCWHPLSGRSSALGFGQEEHSPPPTHTHTASLLIYISFLCHSQAFEIRRPWRIDWLCCPRYYVSIASSCLGRRRGLKNVEGRAHTLSHMHVHTRAVLWCQDWAPPLGEPPAAALPMVDALSCCSFHVFIFTCLPLLAQHSRGTLKPICTIAGLRVAWSPLN